MESHRTTLIRFLAPDAEMSKKFKNTHRILAIFSLAVSYFGCSDDPPAPKIQAPEAPEFGNVSGIVTEAATGNPIPGAQVFLLGQRMEADGDGRYVLTHIQHSDSLNLTVEAKHYETKMLGFSLNAENVSLDVALERLFGAVSGTITDTRTGNPVPGVSVSLLDRTVTTDSDGRYNFIQIPYSEGLMLTAKDADYQGETLTFTLDVERLVLKIPLRPLTNTEAEIGEFLNGFSALIASTDADNIGTIQNKFSETYRASDDPITRFGVESGSIPANYNHVIPLVTELFEKYSVIEFHFHDIQVNAVHAREVSTRLMLDVISQKELELDMRRLTANCRMDFSKEESGWRIIFWQLLHVEVHL